MKFGTRLLHTGVEIDPTTGAVSVPIYQVSTFDQISLDEPREYDYARSGNPTRTAVEKAIALLEGGSRGIAFGSGMAAISSVLSLFSQGDHLVVCEDVYGGTYRALTKLFSKFGINTTFVDTTRLEEIKAAIKPKTKALYLETPSNPTLKISDIQAAANIAKEHNLITIVDNTFMTPYLQRPLELGADIVVHSATKFLGGHSDLIAGLVVTKTPQLGNQVAFIQNCFGAILGPQDCWLLMRGMKTLKVRMDQHQKSALIIARWLEQQPQVEKVYYPGLDQHPEYQLHKRQADGPGGIVSFAMKSDELAKKVLNGVKIPALAVSLGAVESIISFPAKMSHAAMPRERREELGIGDNLIRISVGLEEAEDLIEDLNQAING
ncbi:MAG: PLP-dependent aspartate aminotransferase family protein [Carboxydocellales bacterium]